LDKKRRLIVISSAIFVFMMSIFGGGTAKASPSVPTITPSGDNPVNVVWRVNGHAALVTASMIEIGWHHGDQLPEHHAFAMLMRRMVKPELNASEVCHRLALSEGQKENEKGRR